MVGAVAYDPKVVPIWEGISEYFRGAPVEMDVVLVLELRRAGRRAARGVDRHRVEHEPGLRPHASRDGGGVPRARDARHRRRVPDAPGRASGRARQRPGSEGPGPRARAAPTRRRPRSCPSSTSRVRGSTEGEDLRLVRFDSDVGKHGDTGTSERDAVKAVLDGTGRRCRAWARRPGTCSCDRARCRRSGSSRSGRRRPTTTATSPRCRRSTPIGATAWTRHLTAMEWANPDHRRILELEGLREWIEPDAGGLPRRVRRRRRAGDRASGGDRRARGRVRRRGPRSRLGVGVRARCLPVRHRGRARCWRSPAGAPASRTSSRRGAAEPGMSCVGVEPDGDRTLYLIRPRGARAR